MKPFTREDIFYTAEKLKEANIIELDVKRSDQGLIDVGFGAITFIGHAYLDSIRSSSAWSGLKKV